MPLYDVHLIELVRVKVAAVQADSPEQALALARCVDMHQVLHNESPSLSRNALRSQPQAKVESVSFFEAPTDSALVEIADSNGRYGEHHFIQNAEGDLIPREQEPPANAAANLQSREGR